MSERKWTPGPWELGVHDDGATFVNGGGGVICKCDGGLPRSAATQLPHRANAQLIAAAPALYDALEEIIAANDAWDANPGDDDRVKRAMEAGRAALQSAGPANG